MRLVYLNLLWIAFSLLGIVLFGFFPATAAMFSVVRKWIMGETDVRVFKEFWQTYRKEFWKANRL
ncbi:YesL family protein [Bacillus sp. J33]|uniref:YesL family protein n=1 Tax=Bacillus sp. J33 TaxID=935836 RepID=UPI000A02BFF6